MVFVFFSALHFLLKTTCPEQWISMEGFGEQLKGLVPYTGITVYPNAFSKKYFFLIAERHFQRLSKLKQVSFFYSFKPTLVSCYDIFIFRQHRLLTTLGSV